MHIIQAKIEGSTSILEAVRPIVAMAPDVVLVFGAPAFFASGDAMPSLASALGNVPWLGCSTAGEIFNTGVSENSIVVTGVRFDAGVSLRLASALCPAMEDSRAAGEDLAAQLVGEDLQGVFLLAPGVQVNGSEMIAGARSALGEATRLSGGLAGDGAAFVRTFTVINGIISERALVGIGFYGKCLRFINGSFGGWNPFGPLRKVTRASGNVLYEMDGEPALSLYKRYLGDHAAGLPGTGLLFPLSVLDNEAGERALIRTLIGIDEAEGSLIFAGDIPEGCFVRMMQASVNTLVDGAQAAAESAAALIGRGSPGLALLVSCVGRKLVMAGRTEEEIEAVAETFGRSATVAGFYSYGEISPGAAGTDCRLHNQTMTVTFITET